MTMTTRRNSASSRALALALALALGGCGEAQSPSPAAPTPARVTTEAVEYRDGDTVLEGFLAYDAAREGRRPGVLVVHEWWGLGEHAKERARRLAALGHVAFCADMYGKGKLTDDPAQAKEWSGAFYADPQGLARRRLDAALAVLKGHPRVDAQRLGAIGFCFGGSQVLELAWSGAPLRAVVSFHGNPAPPRPEDAAGVNATVLVCHGAADPFVPPEVIHEFEAAMRKTSIDWMLVQYAGAVHSFTSPEADARGLDGAKHHPVADRRSWEHMVALFAERLGT
jgi:dienelactone hydrolase